METKFTWDPEKAARNSREHGVSFEAALEIFADPNVVVLENYHMTDEGEQRYGAIGMTQSLVLLLVIFVDRSEPNLEVIRIISARKAERYESKIYAAHIAN